MNYLWFARTASQRKLNWYGTASLELKGTKTTFAIEERYVGTFSRPSFEVDARVQQELLKERLLHAERQQVCPNSCDERQHGQ